MKHRFKKMLPLLALALVLSVSAPAPAHADAFSSFLSTMTSMFSQLMKAVTSGSQSTNATVAGTGQILADQQSKIADFNAQAGNLAAQNQVAGNITRTTEDPTDMTCQVAADRADHFARRTAEEDLVRSLAFVLAHLYINPASGTALGDDKIVKALCDLGATGKKGGCTVEASGELKGSIEGGDWDVTIPVIQNACIPIDRDRLITEINKLATADTYTLSDPTLKEAMVAFLSIRINRKMGSRIPGGKETETLSGRNNAARMREIVSQVLASSRPLLRAMAWNACLSTTMLPNCKTENAQLITYLTNRNAPDMPTGNYCISRTQKYDAMSIRDQDAQVNVGKLAGTKYESAMYVLTLENNIDQREQDRDRTMAEASNAAALRPDSMSIGDSARPIAENEDMQELLSSIRKLTRALENQSQQLPRSLEVKTKIVPGLKHVEEAARGETTAGVLPPIRQEFPAVP